MKNWTFAPKIKKLKSKNMYFEKYQNDEVIIY